MKRGLLLLVASLQLACGSSTSPTGTSGSGTSGGVGSLGDGGFTGAQCTPPENYTGNSKHVGAFCSRSGGQCNHYGTLQCAIDASPQNGGNICILVGCNADTDCGEGACCTGNSAQGPVKACVPVQCVNGPDGGLSCPIGQ